MTATLHYAARKHMRELYKDHRWGLLTVLTLHTDIRNRCWPSMAYLADEMGGIGLKTLTDAKKWLIEHGAIELVPYGQRVGKEKQLPKRQHVYQLTGIMTINGETFPYLYSSDISGTEISQGKISPQEIIAGEISQGESKGITTSQDESIDQGNPDSQQLQNPTGLPLEQPIPDEKLTETVPSVEPSVTGGIEDKEKSSAKKESKLPDLSAGCCVCGGEPRYVHDGKAYCGKGRCENRASIPVTRVVNVQSQAWRDTPESERVYIGRNTSPGFIDLGWGNPYKVNAHGTRDEVIAKYRADLVKDPVKLAKVRGLRGKALGCWCKAKDEHDVDQACHGDVLAELAGLPDEQLQKLIDKAIRDRAHDAIADLCYGSHNDYVYKMNGSLIGKVYKDLSKVETPLTAERVNEFSKRWYKHDWRGQKKQKPTWNQVISEWTKLMLSEEQSHGHDIRSEGVLGEHSEPTRDYDAERREKAKILGSQFGRDRSLPGVSGNGIRKPDGSGGSS